MPDRSSWVFLILFIFIDFIVTVCCSFSHSYISSLNEKKLEKDSGQSNKRADKLMTILEKRHKLLDLLSCMRTLLALALGILITVMLYNYVASLFNLFIKGNDILNLVCRFLSAFSICFVFGLLYYALAFSVAEKFATKKAYSENSSYKELGTVKFSIGLSNFFAFPVYGISRLICKIFSLENSTPDEFVSENEILSLVDIGEENGGIESAEKEMIENIFDFSEVRAGDIMTHRTSLAAIDIESTEEEILEIINETQYSRFPVYREDIDHIVGILSAKTFYANVIAGRPKKLEDIIFKPYVVPTSVHADKLLEEMQKKKTHMALVVDEYGGTSGIVTMEDLLERIVGNIYDETDDPVAEDEIIKLDENLYRIAGSASMDSVMEVIDVELSEDDDFDTFGGLIFSCFTVIPTDGTLPVVDAYGLHIEVEEMNERRVERALVSVVPKTEDEKEEEE